MPPITTSASGRLSSSKAGITPSPRLSSSSGSVGAVRAGVTKATASKTSFNGRLPSTQRTITTEVELASSVMEDEEAPHSLQEASSRVGAMELWPGSFSPNSEVDKGKSIVWLDIDNTLYKKSTRIAELMSTRIRSYFRSLGLSSDEAESLHTHYYKSYGLAIRGLVKHHQIDAVDYDSRCDASLPLEDILKPDLSVKKLLSDLDRRKCRVFALTNAYKTHALRVLKLLELDSMIEGIIYCDYSAPNFVCKPEAAFYQAAMSFVGATDPTKCHFVDDSLPNVQAARQLGWGSCVFFQEVDEEATLPPPTQRDVEQAAAFDVSSLVPTSVNGTNGDLSASAFDEATIKQQFQALPANMRIKLLNIVLDAAMPGDLAAIQRSLERHLRMTRDLISNLPEAVCIRIFERLEVKELLRCRQVSKKWLTLAARPELWRSHALALTESDPVSVSPPSDPLEWENLVKGLYFRERNWANGIAQRVELMHGHTGFVTAMKLKGRNTLVTGSYDETIRVWELSTGKCKKVIKAKAISCLDFLPEEGVLAAGLYDAGRIMVWNMHTWELTHTLTGHNRGIRSLALGSRHLVTVGQDKAIIVWDWRSGAKLSRWGQQSNVSLGVSIVDDDKVVAVTVDGIIRTFSIRKNEMIGQFHISRLAGENRALSTELAGLGGDANMMLWFAAHRRTITVASKDVVVHLEWHEHVVPVEESTEPSRSGTPSLRASVGAESTPARTRKDSTQSNASSARPPSSMRMSVSTPTIAGGGPRVRRDSTESNASTATAISSARRSFGAPSMSPTAPRKSLPLSNGGGGLATPSRPLPALDRARSLNRPNPPSWPAPPNTTLKQVPMPSSPSLPNSPFTTSLAALQGLNDVVSPTAATSGSALQRMRIAPNLGIAPRLVDVIRMPDGATGCVDPGKRRVVSASRFSSRAGADRRLYATTLSEGDESAGIAGVHEDRRTVVPIGGAWQAKAKELAQPAHNPMSMILDHESCVYGTSSGLCVRMSFLGHEYRQGWIEEEDGAPKDSATVEAASASQDFVTVTNLVQLRDVWSDLMLPVNSAPDHPGRFYANHA